MPKPLAYFITFSRYGSRLHGAENGSVDRNHNQYGNDLISPKPQLPIVCNPPFEGEIPGLKRSQNLDSAWQYEISLGQKVACCGDVVCCTRTGRTYGILV